MLDMNVVSIVVPTYNRMMSLQGVIDCICAQSHRNLEILIIDDGSVDDTRSVISANKGRLRSGIVLKYYYQQNQGPSAARNLGLEKATGEYIVFFDSDDFMSEERIERQLAKLVSTACDVCVCGFKYNSTGAEYVPPNDLRSPLSYFYGSTQGKTIRVGTQAWMYRTQVVKQVNGYDCRLKRFEDVDLIARLLLTEAKFCAVDYIGTIYNDGGLDSLSVEIFELSESAIKDFLTSRSTVMKVLLEKIFFMFDAKVLRALKGEFAYLFYLRRRISDPQRIVFFDRMASELIFSTVKFGRFLGVMYSCLVVVVQRKVP